MMSNKGSEDDLSLQKLPDDVLIHLFSMLPSDSLMNLDKLGDSRISDLTYHRSLVSAVDFSKCSHLTSLLDFKAFFQSPRSQVITKLNFNHCGWIGAQHLLSCIIKCKNLSALSVRDCNFSAAAIEIVLQKAEKLLCLEWTVPLEHCERCHKWGQNPYPTLQKLERLRLDFINSFGSIVRHCSYFLRHCTSLKGLQLYVVQNDRSSYFSQSSLQVLLDGHHVSKVLENFIAVFDISWQLDNMMEAYDVLFDLSRVILSHNKDAQWKTMWIDDSFSNGGAVMDNLHLYTGNRINFASFSCVSSIKLSASRLFEEVLRYVTKNELRHLCIGSVSLDYRRFDDVIQTVGNNLRCLQINNCCFKLQSQMSAVLAKLFENCTNITEINLYETHILSKDSSPCSTLCALKGLKRVLLMGCHVKRIITRQSVTAADPFEGLRKKRRVAVASQQEVISHPFCDMMSSCSLIEEIQIIDCGEYAKRLNHKSCGEEDISPISQCKNLKTLSLDHLKNFSSLNCLRYIAVQCKRLESLNIDNVGNGSIIPNLCILFTSSESLSVLRIIYDDLYLTDAFWNCLGNAKNLKKMCLVASSWDHIKVNLVVENLAKLKHLELFHFTSTTRNMPSLSMAIKKRFGCGGKLVDTRAELKKRDFIISRSCDKSFHHSCDLGIGTFSKEIGTPQLP